MKLLAEINEDVQILQELHGGKKTYSISGVFMQAGIPNKNGRLYPYPILEKEVNRYVREYVSNRRSLGELGHPSGPTVNMERASHLITELKADGSNFVGKAKVLPTPFGNILTSLLDEGVKLGVSSRGVGSLKEVGGINEVQDDFQLATIDVVSDPSAPEAFVNGVMEGKEYIWESGLLKEIDLQNMKKKINEAAARRDTEAAVLESFESLMRRLAKY